MIATASTLGTEGAGMADGRRVVARGHGIGTADAPGPPPGRRPGREAGHRTQARSNLGGREARAFSRSGGGLGPGDPVIAALLEPNLQRRVGNAVGFIAFSVSLDRFLMRLQEHRLGFGA